MISKDLDSPSTEHEEAGFTSAGDENMEAEADTVSPPWSELPPHIIEKIYSFLDRHNRGKMSLVCRSWANEYGSPSLWRSMKFILPKYEYSMDIYPEARLARKYGAMFHHVEIICHCNDHDLNFVMGKQLHLFLVTLMENNSQLLSLTLTDYSYLFNCQENKIMSVALFGVIKKLILSQNKLQSLDLRNFFLKPSDAVDLLRIICTKNTLKYLSLKDFVHPLTHDVILEDTFKDVSDLENWMNLEMWTIDYSQVLKNIVTNFYEYGNQSHMTEKVWKLHIMNLHCFARDGGNNLGISSSVWKYIREVCPRLKIHLEFEVAGDIRKALDLFITRYMPITSVSFRWYLRTECDQQICSALRHLVQCGINENLEKLRIDHFFKTTNLASDLKNFLQVFPKLRILELYMDHKIEGLRTLFRDWLENRPLSLETVRVDIITLINYTDDGSTIDDLKRNFSDLKHEFVHALKKIGLNLSLEVL